MDGVNTAASFGTNSPLSAETGSVTVATVSNHLLHTTCKLRTQIKLQTSFIVLLFCKTLLVLNLMFISFLVFATVCKYTQLYNKMQTLTCFQTKLRYDPELQTHEVIMRLLPCQFITGCLGLFVHSVFPDGHTAWLRSGRDRSGRDRSGRDRSPVSTDADSLFEGLIAHSPSTRLHTRWFGTALNVADPPRERANGGVVCRGRV